MQPMIGATTTYRRNYAAVVMLRTVKHILLATLLILGVTTQVQAERPRIIPGVQEWTDGNGSFIYANSGRIVLDPAHASQLTGTAQVLQDDLRELKGPTHAIVNGDVASLRAGDIYLSLGATDAELGDEGYKLTITDRIVISARKDNGAFYGTRTVLQLLKLSSSIASGTARDFPRYPLRALHVDNGRKFVTVKWLKDHIKELSYLKMNLFHWHLSDWNNFRLESSTHPEVVAAEHYTKAEVQEMLALAAKYRVIIMPEFEMPGHMGWLLHKHPDLRVIDVDGKVHNDILDLTKPKSYQYVSELLNEWLPLFPGPYFHLGTDESIVDYSKFPHYEAYAKANFGATANAKDVYFHFINWANDIVRSHGKTTWAWDDSKTGGSLYSLNKNIILDSWTNAAQRELAEGFQLINCAQSSLYYVWYTDWEPMQSQLYETWAPHQWSYGNAGPLRPYHPGLLGAKLALWFDKNQTEEYSMSWGMMNSMRTVAQHTWASPKLAALYPEFKTISSALGRAPGTSFPSTEPPIVQPGGPYQSALGQSITFNTAGTVARDGTINKYKWDFGDGGTSTEANPTYIYRREGAFKALLVVTDSNGMTAGNEANVTVGSSIPRVDGGADQTVASGATVTLSGSATDSDGGTLNYRWQQMRGPMISIRNAGAATATFTAPNISTASELELELSVRDSTGLIGYDRVVVRVQQGIGTAPVVNAGSDQSVSSASTVTLRGSATDADGGTLSYSWRQVSGSAVTLDSANMATASFTAPSVTMDSTLEFELSVRNAGGLTGQDRVVITVQPATTGSAPVVNAGADQTVAMGAWVTLNGSATDADGGALNYAWRQVSGPSVNLENPMTASNRFVAPTAAADVELVFELAVTDSTARSGADRVTVRAQKSATGSTPVVNAGADQTIASAATVWLRGSASDADGGTLSYRWAQTSGPAVTLSRSDAPDVSFVAPIVSTDTVIEFALTVTDSSNLSNQDQVRITVQPLANTGGGGNGGDEDDGGSGGGSTGLLMLAVLAGMGYRQRSRHQ